MNNKRIEIVLLYGLNLLLLLIFWGGLLRYNFNADTVSHMVAPDADVISRLEAGRYIVALGDYLLLKLGLRMTSNISIAMLASFLILALAMTILYRQFSRWCREGKWWDIGAYIGIQLVFLNVLSSEIFMFNEFTPYFAFAYLMAVMAFRQMADKKYISMLIYLVLAVFTYQYAVIFAAILMAVSLCLENRFYLSLKAIWKEGLFVFICMAAGVFDLLSVKLLEKLNPILHFGKSAGIGDVGEKIKDALESFIALNKSSDGILPGLWIPFLFSAAVWGIILCFCFQKREWKKAAYVLLVWLGSNMLLYVIPFVQTTVYFPPRMSFCFYLVQGMLVVMAYGLVGRKGKQLLTIACGGYLAIHLMFAEFIVVNRFVSNTLDEVYVNIMYQELLKYEEETGNRVTKLVVVKDAHAPDSYDEVGYHTHQINERTLGTVNASLIQVVTGRELELLEVVQVADMSSGDYPVQFENKDWDYFDVKEQLAFHEDVAYWCIF